VETVEIDDRRALTESDDEDDEVSEPAPPCPSCKYQLPNAEFAARPKPYGPMPVDICLNCGSFMTFDEALDDAEARFTGVRTPTPVLTTSMDFARFTPATCKKLLQSQSITHRLAQMRGYHLGKQLKMRSGRA
jgi:hypothetical protein